MMIRPVTLEAIQRGEVDLAFRRWDSPRVKVGTRMRTAVGLIEVTSLERVAPSALRADDARRAGAATVADLRAAVAQNPDRPLWRIGLVHAGADPRDELRSTVPGPAEIADLLAWLDRLDAASSYGAWTRTTLRLIDEFPTVRAPELAERMGRPTQVFKTDVRKLKEKGLTESLAIGYRLSPRGAAVLDHGGPARERTAAQGTDLPRTIGAPATGALRAVDIVFLEQLPEHSAAELLAMHGVGPVAITRLRAALAERGLAFRGE